MINISKNVLISILAFSTAFMFAELLWQAIGPDQCF
jgi:hypothetical protein